jgi:hypothetical protein
VVLGCRVVLGLGRERALFEFSSLCFLKLLFTKILEFMAKKITDQNERSTVCISAKEKFKNPAL